MKSLGMLFSFLTICFSELMENNIAKAVACAKQIVSEQGITAWYVAFFSASNSIEM